MPTETPCCAAAVTPRLGWSAVRLLASRPAFQRHLWALNDSACPGVELHRIDSDPAFLSVWRTATEMFPGGSPEARRLRLQMAQIGAECLALINTAALAGHRVALLQSSLSSTPSAQRPVDAVLQLSDIDGGLDRIRAGLNACIRGQVTAEQVGDGLVGIIAATS